MKARRGLLTAFSRRKGLRSGVTTIEYAIMLSLVAISVTFFGLGISGSVTSVFSRMIVALDDSDSDSDSDSDKKQGN